MSSHGAVVEWSLRPGDDFAAGHYSRAHALRFDGGASLAGSSSPSVVPDWSDPAAVDPEEMLVASLSSCHMLWFLDVARRAGLVVERYRDAADGEMGKIDGRVAVSKVTLRPLVTFADPRPDVAQVEALHHKAHTLCFIANSVRTDVVVEPARGAG